MTAPTECQTCGHHPFYHRHPSGCLDCECTWHWVATTEARTETVKRASLWHGVQDTYRTESELNGFRPTQGALF